MKALRAFNRGLISPLALARTDIDRTALSAETYDNWMPRNLGSMMLRPGKKYLGTTRNNLAVEFIPFVFSTDDLALCEITDSTLRVWVDDTLISRTSVSTTIDGPNFTSSLHASWVDNDESGGVSVWVTGDYLGLTGNGTAAAIREQEVTVAVGDQSIEHALDIVIERGPVTLRVGSTTGDDDYISETTLDTGSHSLALTPTGNFFIEFSSRVKRQVLVDSCDIASSGTMEVTAPWDSADLFKIRYDQSGDIIFCAARGYQQYKIERRATNSWSVVKYKTNDGPFRGINISPTTITPSAISGNVTLAASNPLFKSTDVGGLYRLTSTGQTVSSSLTAQNTFTNTIRVTGVTSSRVFTLTISGRADSTITLQRSLTASTGPWEDVTTYTADTTVSIDDGLDNQIAWYQLGIKTGDYGTDTVVCTMDYAIGSIEGVTRITAYSSATSVSAEVITDLGNTDATDDWYEGEWSSRRGFPSSVALAEGRLGWAGKDKLWLSVSDAFTTFDDLTVGDSGPITRTIGSGPVDTINWMVATRRLLVGAEGAEFACRSSSEDEPLTPSNAHMKSFSTQGSDAVGAAKLDALAIYVQRGGSRLYEAGFGESYEYQSNDLTNFYPEAGSSPIIHIAVQRQPDTRIHCVRTDGTVFIMLHDKTENISCWVKHSGGFVEDVVILPGGNGDGEDAVYYVVKRTIDGSVVRYLEKWALESQCQGGTTSRQLDSHIVYSGASTTAMTGLTHLEGETVAVWGGGKDLGTYTVSSGAITLSEAVTDACIGLGYTAQWKSSKLSYREMELTNKKKVTRLGVILYNSHYQGLKYGPDFTNMDDLPLEKNGVITPDDTVHSTFDEESFSFPGEWDSDARLCLQAASPRPCTVLAAVFE